MVLQFHRMRHFFYFLAASLPILLLSDVRGSYKHAILVLPTIFDRFFNYLRLEVRYCFFEAFGETAEFGVEMVVLRDDLLRKELEGGELFLLNHLNYTI